MNQAVIRTGFDESGYWFRPRSWSKSWSKSKYKSWSGSWSKSWSQSWFWSTK